MDKISFYRNARTDLSGPLDGIKVVEATTTWAGPMAGCVLADLGATVIKIEHPKGELARTFRPFIPDSQLNVPHETVNRNKENVSLDLKQPKGRDLFLKLCKDTDILIENFKPGTLSKWGAGYEDVSSVKPDIVYVSISMYGQYGPYSDRPGYDPLAQNFTGWSSLNGPPTIGPTKAPTWLADDLGGMHGVVGALAALTHRNICGEGQHVDVALVDSLIFQSNGFLTSGKLGIPLPKLGNLSSITAPVNVYKCLDGNIFSAVLLQNHWEALCDLLREEKLSDLTGPDRKKQRELIDNLVSSWCSQRTTTEVVSELSKIGLAVTRVNTFEEAAKLPQINDRDMLQETKLSDGQKVPLTGPAAKFSRTPTKVRKGAPSIGADNNRIFKALGLSQEEMKQLKKEGVI